jgi:integration host factor subunit alpha
MVVTKAVLGEHLFEQVGFNKNEAKEFIEKFFSEIIATLESGEEVKLSGFGNFKLRDKAERPGRNPKTGEVIPVSARRVVTFRVGQKLKQAIEQYEG